jgi:hypothetical protein
MRRVEEWAIVCTFGDIFAGSVRLPRTPQAQLPTQAA